MISAALCCSVLCRLVSLLGVSAPQQASFFSTWTLLLVSLAACLAHPWADSSNLVLLPQQNHTVQHICSQFIQ